MRFADARHVDVGAFYARRPEIGARYRLIGYVGVAASVLANDHRLIWILLAGMVLLWLLAWYQIVGAAWRSSLVAAVLVCAIRLTILAWPAAHAGIPA
jgi:hypothetical protein